MSDYEFMTRALRLARESVGLASPNPQVGCVLVREGIILGEGAHHYDAYDHAEIVALKQSAAAGIDVRGATAYVTLEPCSHHGRTGPCADALIAAGIARCVVATGDPNPAVSGRGIAKLRAAGIEVKVGVLADEAQAINDAFAWSMTQGRPWVTLKAGLSVDGMLAPPPSTRIPNQPYLLTGPESRAEVQKIRHASDAILTGIGTLLADDPLLTDRSGLPRRRPLIRAVVDTHLRIWDESKLLKTIAQIPVSADVWIFCGEKAPRHKMHELRYRGALVTQVSGTTGLDIAEILAHLHSAKLLSVLLEAGSALNGSFLQRDLVDRAVLFYAETELGPAAVPFAAGTDGPFALEQRLLSVRKQTFGADVCVSGRLHDPWRNTAVLE